MRTFKIRDDEYVIEPVPALTSFALQPLVAPVAGRLLGLASIAIQKADGGELGLADLEAFVQSQGLGDGLTALFKLAPSLLPALGDAIGALKPDDLIRLCRGLLAGGKKPCTRNGVPFFTQGDEPFNSFFEGHVRDLWIVLAYAILENYPDFFPKLGARGAPAATASPSVTSSTSPGAGPSTASSARGS